MPKEPKQRIKVLITHRDDGFKWTVVVNELIDAMILDKSQFSTLHGSTYKILEYTTDPCNYGNGLGNKLLSDSMRKAIGGNYVPYYEKMWRNF